MVSPLQQKIRLSGPSVITGNRLADGAVVHRTAAGEWSEDLGSAQILRTPDEARAALAAAQAEGLEAVGPYIAPLGADGQAPGNLRERIRANGPTFELPSDAANAYLSQSGARKSAA